MADTSRLIINPDVDFSNVAGRHLLRNFWPLLGGDLYAAYMLGHEYAAFSQMPPEIKAHGAGMDWSGNGRHIENWGDAGENIGDTSFTCLVSSDEPEIPFTLADIWTHNPAFSCIVLASTVGTARTVALVRSNTSVATPSFSLTLFPQSSDIRAGAAATGTGNATITALTTEIGTVALYGGTYTAAQRNVYAKTGVAATKTAVDNTALTDITNAASIDIGDEAGAGSGNTFIYGIAFVDRVITQAEFDDMLLRQRVCHDAMGSGVPA